MSSLYFFFSLWRLLVVSCFRVHLYKNMYQRNLQQCLINTYFVIISGCWAGKCEWPSSPAAPGQAVFTEKPAGALPVPLRASTQLSGSPEEEPGRLTSGLLCCILGEPLSHPAETGWGYRTKMSLQNLDSGLVVAESFLLWTGRVQTRLVQVLPKL